MDCTDVNTLYNAPVGLLLDQLLSAAEERWNVFNDVALDKSEVGVNAPLNVESYRNIFVSVVDASPAQTLRFVRPVSGVYDWTNEPSMLYWDMTEMVSELGAEPDYGVNAPVTAEWCQWWYNALNKLVQMEYGPGILVGSTGSIASRKTFSGPAASYAAAKAAWAALPWSSTSVATPFQSALKTAGGGSYLLRRLRIVTDQSTTQWKPHLYTGNYTVSAWSQFRASNIYDNVDYPCNEDTYAKFWDDGSLQSGVYGDDIDWGFFDTITASEPAAGTTREWVVNEYGHHAKFDVTGGFDYVAP
jgi:hypothetical protein